MSCLRWFVVTALVAGLLAGCSGGGGAAAPTPGADPSLLPGAPPTRAPAATTAPAAPPTASPPTASPATASPATASPATATFAAPTVTGSFDVAAAPEASGLAASRRNPGLLYVLDDGGTSSVLAIGTDGSAIGRLEVAGLDARDTEDLAIGRCGPGEAASCLYIGDIGDNLADRDTIDVWRVPEPDLAGGPPEAALGATRAQLRYPDGPRDAEALLVDATGSPIVVTKSDDDAAVYTADGFADQTLRRAAHLALPEPSLPLASTVVGHVVTSADARDGVVLVRTYDAVFRYAAPTPDAPLETFPSWPVDEVRSPAELQGEAIAWAAEVCGYHTVSEGTGDIWQVACEPATPEGAP